MNILITGANGFVGGALVSHLLKAGHRITALVRNKNQLPVDAHLSQVEWIEGNLLKIDELPKLSKIDCSYYLVHGLKSVAADFEYEESLAAVNFVNWIRPTGSKIIYLGGLAPVGVALSPHLRSRHLTGAILRASGAGTLEFRASIVLGEGSLSFEMIKALVERLPFRPDISQLSKACQPLALKDLLKYLEAALHVPKEGQQIVEIGGPEVSSYGELMELYAELAGLKRKKIKIPEVEFKVLTKVMDYVLPEYSDIGKKLAESLEFPTVVSSNKVNELFPGIKPVKLRQSMEMAKTNSKSHYPSLWEKDFLKTLLSDKILTQSGLLSPELLKNLEKVGKLKDILSRK